jgi:hypothetical protein
MAASNAYFWTERGWDGTEEMMGKSRVYCTSIPLHHRTELFSKETAKTIAITLQGVQAIYSLIGGLTGQMDYPLTVNLATIFFPLAVFGLMRLPTAPWITEDYRYADYHTIAESSRPLPDDHSALLGQAPLLPKARTLMSMGMVEPYYSIDGCFHPFKSWRGFAVRIGFIIPLFLLLILCIIYTLPASILSPSETGFFTVSNFLLALFFLFLLSATVCVFTFYFFIHTSTSSTTVIPCLTSMWYKIYTILLFLLMFVLFLVSALETRTSPCGQYTTIPKYMDTILCDGGFYLSPNNTFWFVGVVYRNSSIVDAAVDSSRNSSLMMIPFQGFCQWRGDAGWNPIWSAEHMMLGGNSSSNATW